MASNVPENDEHGKRILNILSAWQEECDKQHHLHSISFRQIRRKNILTFVPSLVCSSISSLSVIGIGQRDASGRPDITLVALGAVGLFGGLCQAVNRYLCYTELQCQHAIYREEYLNICNEIKVHCAIGDTISKTFQNIDEFSKYIKARIDHINTRAPAIPSGALRVYQTTTTKGPTTGAAQVEVRLS